MTTNEVRLVVFTAIAAVILLGIVGALVWVWLGQVADANDTDLENEGD